MKPFFDIIEVNVNCKCNQKCTITVEYVVYNEGPARICFDIPNAIPVFFENLGSNSFSHFIPNPQPGVKASVAIPLAFESSKKDNYTFILTGSITDSNGKTRSDYTGVNLSCS